jgi:hypothetical protein
MRITNIKHLPIKNIIHTDSNLFIVKLDGKALMYEAYGDCCSRSFIEDFDIQIPPNTIIREVHEVTGKQEEVDGETYKWTFYKFYTNKGVHTLSFRNESNGYYNGSLEFVAEIDKSEVDNEINKQRDQ